SERVLPYYVRATQLATHYRTRYERSSALVFVLPTVAVLVVTFQILFSPRHPDLAFLEVSAMLALLLTIWRSHRARVHHRWISFRYLAERIRSVYFLTLAGLSDQHTKPGDLAYLVGP